MVDLKFDVDQAKKNQSEKTKLNWLWCFSFYVNHSCYTLKWWPIAKVTPTPVRNYMGQITRKMHHLSREQGQGRLRIGVPIQFVKNKSVLSRSICFILFYRSTKIQSKCWSFYYRFSEAIKSGRRKPMYGHIRIDQRISYRTCSNTFKNYLMLPWQLKQ
jgi:hypothetical protein